MKRKTKKNQKTQQNKNIIIVGVDAHIDPWAGMKPRPYKNEKLI